MLYDIGHPIPLAEFDHPGYFNSCTMKSGTFVRSDYVFSGSDNFNVYGWKIPDFERRDHGHPQTLSIKRADFVLQGHLSIVNQVQFCDNFNILATSGIEKKIKLWSPFNIAKEGDSEIRKPDFRRRLHNRIDYFSLVLNSTELEAEDLNTENTEENMKMIAFFDTLVQRETCSDEDSTSSTMTEESISDTETDDIDILMVAKQRKLQEKQRKKSRSNSEYVATIVKIAKQALINDDHEEEIPGDLRKSPTVNEQIRSDILSSLTVENCQPGTSRSPEHEDGIMR